MLRSILRVGTVGRLAIAPEVRVGGQVGEWVGAVSAMRSISTSAPSEFPYEIRPKPRQWPSYNRKVYPPQEIGEKPRPAYICHMKNDIRVSKDKAWWVACMIRGMSIDEALKQLDYVKKKSAMYIKQTLLEAQELAVQQNNVEYKSNLWVAESFTGKGFIMKGIRRHARQRMGIVEYQHCHYFVRLEEGPPPENYYDPNPDGPTILQRWIDERRSQRVWGSL